MYDQLDREHPHASRCRDRHRLSSRVPIGPDMDPLDFQRTPPTRIRVLNKTSTHIFGSGGAGTCYAAISATGFSHRAFLNDGFHRQDDTWLDASDQRS